MIWKRENIWYERGNKNDMKEGNKNGMKEGNKNGMKEGNRNDMREGNRNYIRGGNRNFMNLRQPVMHSRVHFSLNFIKRRNCNGYFQGSYCIIVIYCICNLLWAFTWLVHFELLFRFKGIEQIHTKLYFLFLFPFLCNQITRVKLLITRM